MFLVLIAAGAALAAFAVLGFASGRLRAGSLACVAAVVALAGLCVNPVQQGIAPLAQNELLAQAQSIAHTDPDAAWAGDDSIASQALLASGLRTVTSVAIYPDLDTWRAIDPAGAYEDDYNRYAHISLSLADGETSFTSGPDSFAVQLNPDDVAKLGIRYWLSREDLAAHDTERTTFTPLTSNDLWTIWSVNVTNHRPPSPM